VRAQLHAWYLALIPPPAGAVALARVHTGACASACLVHCHYLTTYLFGGMLVCRRMLVRAYRRARVCACVVCCISFYSQCALWLFGTPRASSGLARMRMCRRVLARACRHACFSASAEPHLFLFLEAMWLLFTPHALLGLARMRMCIRMLARACRHACVSTRVLYNISF
jgi:hypothetical protein